MYYLQLCKARRKETGEEKAKLATMLVETSLGIQYLSENYLAKTITVTTMR
jgi:hypothetical protein